MKQASRILVITGIMLILASALLFFQRINPHRLSFSYTSNSSHIPKTNEHTPVSFQIKKVGIDLPVIPSHISKNSWETTDKGISYLASSPIPGEMGNSILYGHNWTSLMGNLVYVKPGDMITIHYSDKSVRDFKVKYTITVSPSEGHILSNTTDKRITVYTCTGFLDSQRFVVVAEKSESLTSI